MENVTAQSDVFAGASLDFRGDDRRRGEVNRRKLYARLRECASCRTVTYIERNPSTLSLDVDRGSATVRCNASQGEISSVGLKEGGASRPLRRHDASFHAVGFKYFPRESGLKRFNYRVGLAGRLTLS